MKGKLALVVAALAVTTGCVKQYVVVSLKNSTKVADVPAELFSTPKYKEFRPQVKTVVVLAPEHCSNSTAAVQSGRSTSSKELLKTECGIWLGEFEKALVTMRFRVISWRELARYGAATKGGSVMAFAKELGADVVFMINSLEVSNANPESVTDQDLAYFASDPYGSINGPKELNELDRQRIRTIAQHRFGGGAGGALSATVDISAVHASTAEAFWFYRRSYANSSSSVAPTSQMLLRGRAGKWRQVIPKGLAEDVVLPADEYANSESFQSRSGGAQDWKSKLELELARTLLQDFVKRFSTGA